MAARNWRDRRLGPALVTLVSLSCAISASAGGPGHRSFRHISTFDVTTNGNEVAGIVDAATDEGDYEDENGEEGGGRGFAVFRSDTGQVEFESAATFEHASARIGHYNEGRSANKGGEPEAVEYGRFGRDRLLFVGGERANVIGVYDVRQRPPELRQLLPTGSGPEGIKAVARRNLLVAAAENAEDGFPSMITIYRRSRGAPDYPQIESADDPDAEPGGPIPWVAQSGLATDLTDPHTLEANSILTPDKLEGLSVAPGDGFAHIVTDNDGLDDALGQTVFIGIGTHDVPPAYTCGIENAVKCRPLERTRQCGRRRTSPA